MKPLTIQQQIFNHWKNTLPAHLSLLDELSRLPYISPDGFYKRLRSAKPITFQELKMTCEKYHISLDLMLQLKSNAVVFQAQEIGRTVSSHQ